MVRATADTRWMSELDLYLAGAELRVFDQAYPEVQQLGTNRQSAAPETLTILRDGKTATATEVRWPDGELVTVRKLSGFPRTSWAVETLGYTSGTLTGRSPREALIAAHTAAQSVQLRLTALSQLKRKRWIRDSAGERTQALDIVIADIRRDLGEVTDTQHALLTRLAMQPEHQRA